MLQGYPQGSHVVAGGRIPPRQADDVPAPAPMTSDEALAAEDVEECVDCGEPIDACACADDDDAPAPVDHFYMLVDRLIDERKGK